MGLLFLSINIVLSIAMTIAGSLNMLENEPLCIIELLLAIFLLYSAFLNIRSLITINVVEAPFEE